MKNKPFVIAGSGRSGTTWVMDVLAETNNLRPIFEPLNPSCISDAKRFANLFLQDDASNVDLTEFLEKVFAGEIQNIWTKYRLVPDYLKPYPSKIKSWSDCYNLLAEYKKLYFRYRNDKKKYSDKYLFKFIRANLFLSWMQKNFNIRLVFIVRHPCSVILSKIVASKLGRGIAWDYEGQCQRNIFLKYMKDEELKKQYQHINFNVFLHKGLSEIEWHATLWCIENILPIYRLQQDNYPIFFYEDIVMNPEREFGRMNKIFGFKKLPESTLINKPSQQSSQEFNNQLNTMRKLTRWMDVLTSKDLCEVEQILHFFNVTLYNTSEPLPISRIQATL